MTIKTTNGKLQSGDNNNPEKFKKGESKMNRYTIYQMVTDRIVEQLEKGVVPWEKSWVSVGGIPRNLITNFAYKGINRFLLAGFDNPYFITFNQLKKIGGRVRKGEKASMIVFWKIHEYKEIPLGGEEEVEKKKYLLRYYNVFNISQCENLTHKRLEELKEVQEHQREIKHIDEAEAIVNRYQTKPEIRHGKPNAYYSPKDDYIGLPDRNLFNDDDNYYAVLFHEMIHSTGHKNRLNRLKEESENVAHKESYGKEELVAEMGAGFLCGIAGIEHVEHCASYLQNWIDTLNGDVSLLVKAGSQAQKATDYILEDNLYN